MIVVSTSQFREKQGKYFGMAKNGEDIIVKSRENGSFKIVPVTEDDTLMSKTAFFAQIDSALQEAKEGKGKSIKTKDELFAYMESL